MVLYLKPNQKSRSPFSVFKGKPGLAENDLYLDRFGFINKEMSSCYAVFLGSSVVTDGYGGKTLTDLLSDITGQKYYNCACGSWNTTQAVNEYIYSISQHIEHEAVILLCGYNDIFAPISYDPRPQYPFNFLFDEIIYSNIEGGGDMRSGYNLSMILTKTPKEIDDYQKELRKAYGDINGHVKQLLKQWLNSIVVLKSYCYAKGKKVTIIPQLTILDRKRKSNEELKKINQSKAYYELVEMYRREYWKFIAKNLDTFTIVYPLEIGMIEKEIFIDPVHYTQDGYSYLVKALAGTKL